MGFPCWATLLHTFLLLSREVCDIHDQTAGYHGCGHGAVTLHLSCYRIRKFVLFECEMVFHPHWIICLRHSSSAKYDIILSNYSLFCLCHYPLAKIGHIYRNYPIICSTGLSDKFLLKIIPFRGLWCPVWLRQYPTNQKVVGLIPDVITFFQFTYSLELYDDPGVKSASNRN